MNDLFKTLIDEGVVVVYMGDILIFTESLEQHHETLQNAFEILCTNHLYLKPEKYPFTQLKVEYLGLILSQGQVAMDHVKVSGVQDWPIPRNVTEVKSPCVVPYRYKSEPPMYYKTQFEYQLSYPPKFCPLITTCHLISSALLLPLL